MLCVAIMSQGHKSKTSTCCVVASTDVRALCILGDEQAEEGRLTVLLMAV